MVGSLSADSANTASDSEINTNANSANMDSASTKAAQIAGVTTDPAKSTKADNSANLAKADSAKSTKSANPAKASQKLATADKPPFYGKKNILQVVGGADMLHSKTTRSGFSGLGIIGVHYYQPNRAFRLPGRLGVELEYMFGGNRFGDKNEAFNQVIFGGVQDVFFSLGRHFYAGLGIGIYIRSRLDSRVGSAFTFGERLFMGYAQQIGGGGGLSLEIFIKHYSNGDLTPRNAGFNFLGLGAGYSF
ncbi:acyloxyacyl hydrolase [Helicobacter sp. CLO-3]|uniref:acyloxyacyl hydrolase n=1 Tax=Helicobacter sp. CLO-3 TaxID=211 RepID=UPI0021092F61|nr:acyloxyacyl hydrolase [Helicobacter sp. CLO-3]